LPDGPLVGRPAESCRKVLQQVEFGKTEINNVVRECGYNSEQLDGKRRAGNSGINLKIWQCINTDVRIFKKNFNLINLEKVYFGRAQLRTSKSSIFN